MTLIDDNLTEIYNLSSHIIVKKKEKKAVIFSKVSMIRVIEIIREEYEISNIDNQIQLIKYISGLVDNKR